MAQAIPADFIVSVNPRVIYGGSGQLVMSGLLLTENPLVPFPQLLAFPSADAVGAYFGVDTNEYKLALVYFNGYDNSFRKGETLYFARRVNTAIASELIGAPVSVTYAAFQTITDGSMTIALNGNEIALTGLDFSSVSALSEVAQVVETH